MHDQRNIVDMDATCGYIGGDQNLCLAAGEIGQSPLSLMLAAVAMNSNSFQLVRREYLGDAVAAAAGAAEHDRRLVALQHSHGMWDTVNRLYEIPRVRDVADVADLFLDLEGQRIDLVPLDEHVDGAVECGREQQRVAITGRLVEQTFHRGKEAHVGHTVGFIDNDELDIA